MRAVGCLVPGGWGTRLQGMGPHRFPHQLLWHHWFQGCADVLLNLKQQDIAWLVAGG